MLVMQTRISERAPRLEAVAQAFQAKLLPAVNEAPCMHHSLCRPGALLVPGHELQACMQARIPELAPRLEAVAQAFQAELMLASNDVESVDSSTTAFPAQQLLDTITAFVQVLPVPATLSGLQTCSRPSA